jgi:hypothetical protein
MSLKKGNVIHKKMSLKYVTLKKGHNQVASSQKKKQLE